MTELNYACLKCGACCHEIEYKKRIPLYPEEANFLIEIAKKRGIALKIIEDLVFLDMLNKKILVVTYKILFEKKLMDALSMTKIMVVQFTIQNH